MGMQLTTRNNTFYQTLYICNEDVTGLEYAPTVITETNKKANVAAVTDLLWQMISERVPIGENKIDPQI